MPSPAASAAAIAMPMASAASTAVLRKVSMLLLACARPCSVQAAWPRRMSPQNSSSTGASLIQGMVPIQSATLAIFAASRVTMMEYCCRSDFEGADCAAARTVSSSGSGDVVARRSGA